MHGALHDRLELAQPFQGGLARSLVPGDQVPFAGGLFEFVEHRRLDRGDLAVEAVFVPGPLGAHLRLQPEGVEVCPGEAAAFGDPLGRLELVGHIDVPGCGADDRPVRSGVGAEAHAAHRFDAAGDADVDGPDGDQSGNQMVGLLGAAALAVDGGGADVFG